MANRSGIVVIIGTSPTTYQWLLDGEIVSTSSTYNISGFDPGIYTLEAKLMRNGVEIANTVKEFTVVPNLPDPVYHMDFSSLTEFTTKDLITDAIFTSIVSSTGVPFNIGDIKGRRNVPYLSQASTRDGSIKCSNYIVGEWDPVQDPDHPEILRGIRQYTVSCLIRFINNGLGALIYNSGWSVWGSEYAQLNTPAGAITGTDIGYNKWVRLTITQERTLDEFPTRRTYEIKVYVDDVLKNTTISDYTYDGASLLGDWQFMEWDSNGPLFPGEIADFKIWNTPFTQQQISDLCAADGIESSNTGILSTGEYLGGLWRQVEYNYGGVGLLNSRITVTSTGTSTGSGLIYRHWLDGDVCWCEEGQWIKSESQNAVWGCADWFFPEHMYSSGEPMEPGGPAFPGNTIQPISIQGALTDQHSTSDIASVLYLLYHYDTQILTLYRLTYQIGISPGYVELDLDGREITRGVWHRFEMYYEHGTSGVIKVYYDGEEIASITGNINRIPYYLGCGFNMGTHIQPGPYGDGNVCYSRNIYTGSLRYSDYLNFLTSDLQNYNCENSLRFVGFDSEIRENESMSLSTESI